MFTYLSRLLYKFQPKPIQKILLAALILLAVGVVLASVVRWLRRRRQDRPESWTGLVTSTLGALLTVLVGLGVLVGLCLHLKFSAGEFARRRGGVSESNFDAVKTIWGRPHVQNELSVDLTYTTTNFYDKDGLELDAEKLRATTQPVGFRREEYEHTIPGNAILEANHRLATEMTYREKGGASYPTFNLDGVFRYKVMNVAERDVTAKFAFPMPVQQGLVHNLSVLANGQPIQRKLVSDSEAIRWEMPLAAGEKLDVAVGYSSRGLDNLRFRPGSGRQLRHYNVKLLCKGARLSELNYPIGCMTPTQRKDTPEGALLTWTLDNAMTRLDMGVILPKKTQKGYHVARVLSAAPWGMVLLVGMMVLTCLASRRPLHWLPLAVLAVSYHLYYLLMAHLGDYRPGLIGGMIISCAALTGLVAIFHLVWAGRFIAYTTLAMFLLFCVGYPLIRISDYSGVAMSALYVALLGYVVVLLVSHRREAEPAPVAAEG